MKKLIYILTLVLLLACNGENVPDCFQNAGKIIQQEVTVDTFDKITVFERIELIVTDAPTQQVTIETGTYLLNDIDVKVEDGRLVLINNNACNLTRDYGITKVYVSAPNLTEIRNSSGLTMRSNGVLNYPSLLLISEDFSSPGVTHTDGDFNVQVNCDRLRIVVNNLSNIFISGTVTDLMVGFYSGNVRFEGANLIAQNIDIFQRSSNDMIVNPQQSLTGQIRGTGDVLSLNRPPVVDVEEFYTGKLLFRD
ncbi:putative autotransporter adhesin-like protein [Flavobacteriaceae bacterium MAR_2010_105]|nr:putative autotransporter adhesin-like protein [Flavobacteriaceae bacterium MAR_2010_105]